MHPQTSLNYFNLSHYSLISRCIELFIVTLQSKIETSLSQISKTQWTNQSSDSSDVSPYIRECKQLLKGNFLKIKDQMESLYLTLYLDKMVVLVVNKFIQNVYKCRKLPKEAFQILFMDIIELKDTMLSLVRGDNKTYSNPKVMQRYQAHIAKTFSKGQSIVKLLGLPNEQFTEQFQMLLEDCSLQEYEKILLVRGVKKTDFPSLTKALENKNL